MKVARSGAEPPQQTAEIFQLLGQQVNDGAVPLDFAVDPQQSGTEHFAPLFVTLGAGIDDLDQSLIDLHLDDVHVARQGGRHPDYREEQGQQVMKRAEITVRVDLHRGAAASEVWTCDLSHDYVSINADYRS